MRSVGRTDVRTPNLSSGRLRSHFSLSVHSLPDETNRARTGSAPFQPWLARAQKRGRGCTLCTRVSSALLKVRRLRPLCRALVSSPSHGGFSLPPSLPSSHAVSRRVLVESMCCEALSGTHQTGSSPPFCTEFCPQAGKHHILAVADEEGIVTLLDVTKSAESQTGLWPISPATPNLCDY